MTPHRGILTSRVPLMAVASAMLAIGPVAASAQATRADARLATRAELELAARELEQAAASTAYSERTRARARTDLAQVRRRLAVGDFQVGQRMIVTVFTNSTEGRRQLFADTVTVLDSMMIDISGVRRLSLAGVLRSELAEKVSLEVGVVVRNADATVRPLVRVAVLGSVATPSFFAVPSETLLDQLLAMSGGPVENAPVERMRVMRGDTTVLEGRDVMAAIAEGRTLDALELRDGDALVVAPGSPPWDRSSTLSIVSLVLSPLITFLLVR